MIPYQKQGTNALGDQIRPPMGDGQDMHAMNPQMHGFMDSSDPNMDMGSGSDLKRTYRKKKIWCLNLNITIETPDLDNKFNETFPIEISSNCRLKILQQTILTQVQNPEIRELIKNEKMFIYIEGKQPVARKSKSLAEMGVKDGDNLIVTTEMKLPLDQYSDDDDIGDMPPQMDEFRELPNQGFPLGSMDYPIHPMREGEMRMSADPYPSQKPMPNKGYPNMPMGQMHGPMHGVNPMMGQPMMHNNGMMHGSYMGMNHQPMHMRQQPMNPNSKDSRVIPPNKKQMPPQKPMVRPPSMQMTDKKDKVGPPKSPASKKPREIQVVKIMIVQHRFKQHEEPVTVDDYPPVVVDEEVEEPKEEEKPAEEEEKPAEDKPAEEEPEESEMEDRGEENHEEYEGSDVDLSEESKEPYDPNEVWEMSVNNKNKVKSLKKLILEKVDLWKRANIVLLREIKGEVSQHVKVEVFAGSSQRWTEMTEKEMDQPVKNYQDQTIAFKAYMDIGVEVFQRGQSYKTRLTIDPKDPLDQTLRKRTHFWKQFMSKGQEKCVVFVQYKNESIDQHPIEPQDLGKAFIENKVDHQSTLMLVELRNMKDSDDEEEEEIGEEGEAEMEEQEEEQEEQEEKEAPAEAEPEANGHNDNEEPKNSQQSVKKPSQQPSPKKESPPEKEQEETEKKASDVLFNVGSEDEAEKDKEE
mmetsp:Transcript_27996/g.42321  ORF Transcript_27996/g.42321 Transcript_27996/m.42321 type:complete len:691 (-) Transcript_27996:29-2101(-)